MIKILPSLTILNGRCVKFNPDTVQTEDSHVYDRPPLEQAQLFEEHGFGLLHIVDLDSIKKKEVVNEMVLNQLSTYTKMEINYSGGIRTDGGAHVAFESGADTITVGTLAATDPDRIVSWIPSFTRSKLVVAADVKDEVIYVEGWKKATNVKLFEFLDFYNERGILFVKLTDINRDGIMQGLT